MGVCVDLDRFPDFHKCPKCAVLCKRTGEMQIGLRLAGVYQCTTCRHTIVIEGRNYDCELIFAVDEERLLFFPESQTFPEIGRNA